MKKQFPHLTTKIKGRTIKEQPILISGLNNEMIIFTDGYYSILGKDKNLDYFGFLREKDLPKEIKRELKQKGKTSILASLKKGKFLQKL